jgi:hypothetical protein
VLPRDCRGSWPPLAWKTFLYGKGLAASAPIRVLVSHPSKWLADKKLAGTRRRGHCWLQSTHEAKRQNVVKLTVYDLAADVQAARDF